MKRKSITPWLKIAIVICMFSSGLSAQIVLQRCDVSNRWQGSNTISVNNTDKKEGIASISFSGSGTDWFKKTFSQTDVGVDESGWFNLWLYISDVSKFNGDGQIELSSSGGPDVDEYAWPIAGLGLKDGWNHIQLQISDANKTGSPDLKAINFFRIFQFLSGDVIANLDDLRITAVKDPLPSTDVLNIKTPRFTSLDGKVMFGYQGWFSHPDDGSELARWRHWGTMQDANTLGVEMYPDMREHESDEQYATGLSFSDGRPARIYSAYNRKTVMRHMKWLRDYDLDGVFLQRFNVSLRNDKLRKTRDTVTVNVMKGCEKYGRTFVNMYDLSGLGGGNMDQLIEDWKHLVDDLKITESPNYLWHRGKPLVSLWGFTVRDDLPLADLEQAIEFFTNSPEEKYRASIMLGTNQDFHSRTSWAAALSKVDVISPWTVGRYNNSSSNNNFVNSHIKPGQDWCDARNIDFLPVVWPGFSWYNLKREGTWQQNQIPRDGGNFFWIQASRVVSANAKSVYIAMFDEVDEATAMYKLTETREESPEQGYWLALDADGYDLPSDWYLRCAKKLSQVVRGLEDNNTALGTPPDGIDGFKADVISTKCATTDGKITFLYPEVDAGSVLEFSIDGGQSYPYVTPPGSSSMETSVLLSGVYNVWVRRSGGANATDLGPYTIFDFYPDGTVEATSTTCGIEEGILDFKLGDNPYMGPVQFSIDSGASYVLTTTEGTWNYSIENLARGEYDVWVRWADEACPSKLETISIDADPIPVTLFSSVDGEAFTKIDENKVYACPGFSLELQAEPAEDSWTWSWTGVLGYQAAERSIKISDEFTSDMLGKYYVSYRDEINDCEVKDQLFYVWKGTDCPVGITSLYASEQTLVYPNPTSDILFLKNLNTNIKLVQITDLSGKTLLNEEGDSGSDQVYINITSLGSGTYIYHIEGENEELFQGTFVKN